MVCRKGDISQILFFGGYFLQYNEILGKGAFKTVYKAFDEVDGIEVAWNQVKIHDLLQSPEELERLYSEVNLLKSLKHKNIIKFYTSWVDAKNKNVNFITEVFNSGTLRQYRKKHKHVDIRAVKNWARQILRGLLYLHSHDPPIIHRDLKCDNVFVNGNNGEVKIGDLGLATILRQAHAAHSVIGTPEFMAPELYEEEYNELVDIYSFGMCLLEIVTFEYPYSECTNAAQIYKKVTSGKKPAALGKVKDPDVRKFIENCLAVASKRLPARELLSDPFLQCDVNKELSECPPMPVFRPGLGGDDSEAVAPKEDPESSLCHRMSKLAHRESKAAMSDTVCDESKLVMTVPHLKSVSSTEALSNSDCDSGPLSGYLKDDQLQRSRDFRVKGKKKDDSTVSLRLRIANPQGHVRYIHFVFDIESDTAISVASEMVEELQLSDQDVNTVAEMIDAQIVALVPDWKPGASFEDVTPDTGHSDQDNCLPDLSCRRLEDEVGVENTTLEGCCTSNSLITQDFCSSGLLPSSTEESPARGEGMMYGRFEDVTYNQGGSDYSPSSSGAPPPIPSISLDHQALEDSLCNVGGHTLPEFGLSERDSINAICETVSSLLKPKTVSAGDADPEEVGCMAFNDLVECQRNAGCSKYTHQTWELIMNMAASPEDQDTYAEVEMHEMDKGFHSPVPWASGASTVITPTDLTDGEEELDEELKSLAFEQEKELVELRRKHEFAILEAKTRWEKKSGSTLSSKPVYSDLQSDNVSTSNFMHDSSAIGPGLDRQGLSSGCVIPTFGSHGLVSPPIDWEAQLATVRELSSSRKSLDSDRLSLSELSAMTKEVLIEKAQEELAPKPLCSSLSGVVITMDASNSRSEMTVIGPTALLRSNLTENHTGVDGEKQVCVPQEVGLHVVGMGKVYESSVSYCNNCTSSSHRSNFVPLERQVQPINAGNEIAASSMALVCDSKMHLDELELRHLVSDTILDSTALDEVRLLETEYPHSEVLDAKVEPRNMGPSFPGLYTRSDEDEAWQAAQTSGSLPQWSAGPLNLCLGKTGGRSEASNVSNTSEEAGFCAEPHSSSNKPQALDAPRCDLEKTYIVQPKVHRTSERMDTYGREKYGRCTSSPVVSIMHEAKSCIIQEIERQENPYRTGSIFQTDGDSLESKKEQLQRSIARLEAKTLEGLQIGLVANLGTRKLPCGPSIQPTGSTPATPQSRPNSASESNKQ
ncbi:hypothetical protein L7F22_006424 [Adiantum nelumboides]|nr:hypothetical protein [Adiantum nelumboides]